MLSFINLMGGKNPLNDPEDEEEGGEKKPTVTKIIGWQDALVIIIIIAAIFGGYKYYQHTKQESADMLARCALLFDGGAFAAARDCYDSTWNLSYTPTEMDSLRVSRLGVIQDMQSAQEFALETAMDALIKDDTAAVIAAMRTFKGPILLNEESTLEWNALLDKFADKLAAADSTVTDSTAADSALSK